MGHPVGHIEQTKGDSLKHLQFSPLQVEDADEGQNERSSAEDSSGGLDNSSHGHPIRPREIPGAVRVLPPSPATRSGQYNIFQTTFHWLYQILFVYVLFGVPSW